MIPTKIKIATIAIALIIIAALYFFLYQPASQNVLFKYLLTHKQLNLATLINLIAQQSKQNPTKQIFVNYSGNSNLDIKSGITSFKLSIPFNVSLDKNGNVSRTFFGTTINLQLSSFSYSLNINFTDIRNNSISYVCSDLFQNGGASEGLLGMFSNAASSTTQQNMSSVGCIDNKTLGVYGNATSSYSSGLNPYKYTSNFSNSTILKDINLTISSVSESAYKGSPCVLVKGNLSGYIPINSIVNITSDYYYYGPKGFNIGGKFSGCFSNLYNNVLLTSTSNITISVGQNKTSFNTIINETSLSSQPLPDSEITALPGPLLNLSALLPSYCGSYYISGIPNLETNYSYCSRPMLNLTGTLRANFSFGNLKNGDSIYGLACISPFAYYTYSYTGYPSANNFTAVNISLHRGTNNLQLFFNCPVNSSTKIGSYKNYDLWVIYYSNGANHSEEMANFDGYVLTEAPLGRNHNTGRVPSKIVLPQSSTSSFACSNPPWLNITSVGPGVDGGYEIGSYLSWEACVSPYSSAVLSLINVKNNNTITFTPDSFSDAYGYVSGTFQTESNISPGPWYLNITDSSTGKSVGALFNMTNATYSITGSPTTTVPPQVPSINSQNAPNVNAQIQSLSTLPLNLFVLARAIMNKIS